MMHRLCKQVSCRLLRRSRRMAGRYFATSASSLHTSLEETDPELFNIVQHETERQRDSLALIPSENFTSRAVLDTLGTVMQNKYSEGYPGARYYGGNEYIDEAESLCQKRALELYDLDPEEWGVNVQPLSGSPANFEVYTAVLPAHGRMIALDLPHGGHLSHGYATPTKKISAVSKYFEVTPYRLDESTGTIDYESMHKLAEVYRPELVVTGASSYARHIDYEKFREAANLNNSLFMMDMAHISGLIAGKALPSPFPHADIVTTTTHKSLRGPRGAMIFYRKKALPIAPPKKKKSVYETRIETLEADINSSVFPGHQGGPHNHTISALAVALRQAKSEEFQQYADDVVQNASILADSLVGKGHTLVSGGTDNHLMLWNLRPHSINGAMLERIYELVNISTNKNTVPGDVSALNPGGIRLGTPAMTTRGVNGDDWKKVGELLDRGLGIAKEVQDAAGSKKIVAFRRTLREQDFPSIDQLKSDVVGFVREFDEVPYTK